MLRGPYQGVRRSQVKKRIISVLLAVGLMSVPIGPLTGTAFAAIAEGSVSTGANADSGASTLQVGRPANVGAGDLLVAQVSFEKGSEIAVNPLSPWTLINRRNFGTDIGQAIYYRVATGSEPVSYTWEFRKGSSLESVRASGGISRYTGVNTLHPSGPVVAFSQNSGDTNPLSALGIAAPQNSMLVAFFGVKKQTTLTTPTNMSDGYLRQHPNGSGPTIRASKQIWNGGSTGNRTSTAGSVDKWAAHLVALRPNTVPVYTAPAGQAAAEGAPQDFDLGSFVDPDAHGTWDLTVDWGDGSAPEDVTFASGQATPFAARDLGTRSHGYDDNDTYTVTVTVDDGTDTTSGTFQVIVANVAPTAELTTDDPTDLNEGASATVTLNGASDPSGADTAAGFRYAFACDEDQALADTYADAGQDDSTTCLFDDDGEFKVIARIFDKNDGYSQYDRSFSVHNVAPTAELGNDGPIDEGSSSTIGFTNQFDPSQADTDAGFRHAFACDGNVDALPETYADAGTGATTSCSFDDDGSFTVYGRILDKDDGYSTYPTVVTVNNVAPTATLSNDGPIDEGDSAAIEFTNQSDPSQADANAGFHYAFDCDGLMPTTYAAAGTSASGSCGFDDNGTYTVTGRIFDKDDGFTDYTTDVVVNNVAPTATFNVPESDIDEGSPFTLSLTDEVDAAADTAAGFEYAFDCGSGYGAFGSDPSTLCPTVDDAVLDVGGKIRDKDDDTSEYTGEVAVVNVAPTVTSDGDQEATAGEAANFDLGGFSDPGVNDDPWKVLVTWGDGTPDFESETSGGDLGLAEHTYAAPGSYTVTVRATDKDGDHGEDTFVVTVHAATVVTPAEIRFESACTGMTNAPKGDASKNLTICTPDGVQAGDLLLAQIGFEKGSDAGTDAQITPTGWTLVRRTNSKTDIGEATFYRIATASEPASYTWPFKQAVKATGGIIRYSGVDTSSPIVTSSGNAGDSNKLTALAVNAEAKSMVVALYVFKKKDTTLVVPSSMTERYNMQNPQDVTIRVAEELRATAGSTGDRVATPSPKNSDKWAAQLLVLRAAP
jgi:hypothetical protein